ncbi:hypothetical protein HPP92_027078 [Vanilla planifolia]|uniref:Protein SDA1 n=1 Tax=Vanilla planifolia TaxID=51239 RepID=A0A835PE82_VANPL|nr:hypothetical protein HPP92_027078 [Vanilla planifolia]
MEAGSTPFKRMLVTYYRGNSLQKNKIDEAEKCHQSKKHPKRLHSQAVARTTGEEELRARRSLVVLCDLHRRKVWVMVSTLSFLLGFERVDDDDSEAPSEEDDEFYVITKMLVMGFAEKLFSRLHVCNERFEICPSFWVKKDRGHPIDSKARPKAFGEVSVANDVPSVELLKQDDDLPLYSSFEDEMAAYGFEAKNDSLPVDSDICARVAYEEDEDLSGHSSASNGLEDDACRNDSDEEGLDDRELANVCDIEELNEEIEVQAIPIDGQDEDADDGKDPSNGKKRLNENKEAKKALSQHGLLRKDEGYTVATSKIPSSEKQSAKRVNPVKLEAHVRSKLSKQERVALVRAGRGDREKYKAKIVVKQKKVMS